MHSRWIMEKEINEHKELLNSPISTYNDNSNNLSSNNVEEITTNTKNKHSKINAYKRILTKATKCCALASETSTNTELFENLMSHFLGIVSPIPRASSSLNNFISDKNEDLTEQPQQLIFDSESGKKRGRKSSKTYKPTKLYKHANPTFYNSMYSKSDNN